MDPEAELRAELINALSPSFDCREHVRVRHLAFSRVLTADVVAVPRDTAFAGLTMAFEVKNVDASLDEARAYDASFWARAIRQASDYVYATIEPSPKQSFLSGRRVSSAFVFPAPVASRSEMRYRKQNECEALMRIVGAFEVGVHFRVGKARWDDGNRRTGRRLDLWLGGDVWRSDVGFKPHARGILTGKRPLGSQKVSLLTELTGIEVPAMPQLR